MSLENMLMGAIEKGAAEGAVISMVTHGIAAAGVAAVGYALYPVGEMPQEHCSCVSAIHLAAVAANFGTTCWVTFVAGRIMIRTIPRHIFGLVQSYLFPAFFNVGMATNVISLATYLHMHPRGSWGTSEKTQIMLLGAALVSSSVSAYVISPRSVHSMWEMYQEEHEIGESGLQVRGKYPDKEEHPEFARLHRRFGMWHGVSMLVNLCGFIATGMHMWNLSTHLRI